MDIKEGGNKTSFPSKHMHVRKLTDCRGATQKEEKEQCLWVLAGLGIVLVPTNQTGRPQGS